MSTFWGNWIGFHLFAVLRLGAVLCTSTAAQAAQVQSALHLLEAKLLDRAGVMEVWLADSLRVTGQFPGDRSVRRCPVSKGKPGSLQS